MVGDFRHSRASGNLVSDGRWKIPAYAGMTSVAGIMTLVDYDGFRLGGRNDG
jgi:hypothetical protein